jgi:hypothetical protein
LRGQNPRDDLNALADAIAQSPDIFSLNGKLVWLKNGQLLTVSATILAEIIATRVVTVHLTNRGTPDQPNWTTALSNHQPKKLSTTSSEQKIATKEASSPACHSRVYREYLLNRRLSVLFTCEQNTNTFAGSMGTRRACCRSSCQELIRKIYGHRERLPPRYVAGENCGPNAGAHCAAHTRLVCTCRARR